MEERQLLIKDSPVRLHATRGALVSAIQSEDAVHLVRHIIGLVWAVVWYVLPDVTTDASTRPIPPRRDRRLTSLGTSPPDGIADSSPQSSWSAGTPSIMESDHVVALSGALSRRFSVSPIPSPHRMRGTKRQAERRCSGGSIGELATLRAWPEWRLFNSLSTIRFNTPTIMHFLFHQFHCLVDISC